MRLTLDGFALDLLNWNDWLAEGIAGWVWFMKISNSFDEDLVVDGKRLIDANGSNTTDGVVVGQSEGWTLDD